MTCNTNDSIIFISTKHIFFLCSLIVSSQFCVSFHNTRFTKCWNRNVATGTKLYTIKSTATRDNSENDNDETNKNKGRRSFLVSNLLLGITAWNSNTLPPSVQSSSTIASAAEPSSVIASDLTSWPLGKVAFSLLPIAGTYSRRATIEKEVIPNTIWTYDQIQGIVNVNVPVRQVVIKLSEEAGGGLLVHNPVAPTKQLLVMMDNLQTNHGPIRHIILGTVALEHKGTFVILTICELITHANKN